MNRSTATVAERRALLGEAAVYSLDDAVSLLPGKRETVVQWLRESQLVRPGPAGDVVVWGDVLAMLRGAGGRVSGAHPGVRVKAME